MPSAPATVPAAPEGANPHLDLRAWLRYVATYVDDLIEVAEDQTDPPGERVHRRAGARKLVDEAARSLRGELAQLRRSLGEEGGGA